MNVPSARTIRDVLDHLDFGPYRVFFEPSEIDQFPWKVHGPPTTDLCLRYEWKDEFATYRQAVRDAMARSNGEFGEDRGDHRPGRTDEERAEKHRKAAKSYPAHSLGRKYHEAQVHLILSQDASKETRVLRNIVQTLDDASVKTENLNLVRETVRAILDGRKVRVHIGDLPVVQEAHKTSKRSKR